MSETPESHCRLCAEPTSLNQAFSIYEDTGLSSDLESKLEWLCVDVTAPNNLPKCICLSCYDVLNQMWSFLSQVKGAQVKLKAIYGGKIGESKDKVLLVDIEVKSENTSFTKVKSENVSLTEVKCEHMSGSNSCTSEESSPAENIRELLGSSKYVKAEQKEAIVEVDIPKNPSLKSKSNRKKASKSEVTCNICDREFKYPVFLKLHNNALHTERTKDFTCHICGSTFYNKGSMASHIVNTHEGRKPFKCKYCPKAYHVLSKLKSHMLTHTADKPFSCEVCSKSFKTKRNLKEHEIVHSDSKPFACKICNKSFKQEKRLEAHLRQHTGAKPYQCEYCSRSFSNWPNQYKHMRRIHNHKPKRKEKVVIEDLHI